MSKTFYRRRGSGGESMAVNVQVQYLIVRKEMTDSVIV
jgi:hypothetical protein